MRRAKTLRNIRLGIENLLLHKLRSLLTTLGVVFGVGSVVAMLSVGEGASKEALEQIRKLGSNNIIISAIKAVEEEASAGRRGPSMAIYGLTYEDHRRISETYDSIRKTAPVKLVRKEGRLGRRSLELRVVGTTQEWFELVQRPIIAYLALGAQKKAGNIDADAQLAPILGAAFLDGLKDIWEGLIAGARSMMSVGVATAAAGIIVGVVTSTGLVGRFVQLIDVVSFGNVTIMLVLTAVTSMILGMGLPTTANYILMATLTAPVIVELGGNAGLIFPLIAAHLFHGTLSIPAGKSQREQRLNCIVKGLQYFLLNARRQILTFTGILSNSIS